ncbi:YMGG-like glycine zipper-containing protein [Roseateles cellulosilyticus]|uniref:Glycine zipper domain-containing protein n=1 Tax=Pelomonas cellulosilytica TaxID=2906762 RepID=A0ABS8XLV3_9BURK|nr:glycine zipper domain-containing protein [Pelomonas sp. P8]MCE4553766.1 glycine zipper domain-containing protein [Pelomonas sp. P8]
MNTASVQPDSDLHTGAVYWRITLVSVVAAATLALTACAGMSSRERSTVVGATAGAVVGGAVTGTTTGAAVGAAAGGLVGNEVDKRRNR